MSESERKSAFASAYLVVLKKGQTMAPFLGFLNFPLSLIRSFLSFAQCERNSALLASSE